MVTLVLPYMAQDLKRSPTLAVLSAKTYLLYVERVTLPQLSNDR